MINNADLIPSKDVRQYMEKQGRILTLNTYGHLYPNEQKKLAEMLNTKK